ncbi:MAG: hypothetical protein P4L93_00720 [Coriobacteriia bacterium]|nr:hypothetical protein [Coriobacteriia bacterium]
MPATVGKAKKSVHAMPTATAPSQMSDLLTMRASVKTTNSAKSTHRYHI